MVSSTLHSFSARHRQFIYNSYTIWPNIFKFKNHTHCHLSLSLDHQSGRSTHRVVNTQPGDLLTLNEFFYFSRRIDLYTNTVLTILTRGTTGPVNLLFYFCSVPHRVVNAQPGIQHLNTLSFRLCSTQSTTA